MDKGLEKSLICECPPLSFPLDDLKVQVCYVIPKSWWLLWCGYVGFYVDPCGERPEDLDNSDLVLSKENQDGLVCLRKVAWKRFKGWYNAGPTFKVFIVGGKPQWKTQSIEIILPNNSNHQVSVPLKMTLSEFQDFIIKKYSLTGKLEISTSNSYCTTRHYSLNITLKNLGFDSIAFVKFSKIQHQEYDVDEFELFDIPDDMDEDLLKPITNCESDQEKIKNFSFEQEKKLGKRRALDSRNLDGKGDKIRNVDREVGFGDRELEDFGMREKVESVKESVLRAFEQEKTQLMVKSLKKVRENVERILNDLEGNV